METKNTINTVMPENKTKEELLRYEEAIKNLALARSSYIFQNENADHASIVIKSMLKYAQGGVAIYDDDLSGDVSGKSSDFLDVIRKFVNKSGRALRLVIKSKSNGLDSSLSATLRELVRLYPDKIQVKVASEKFIAAVDASAKELKIDTHINFAVGEDNAFRLEFPAGKRKAFCSFNNTSYSSVLLGIFEENFSTCADYFE